MVRKRQSAGRKKYSPEERAKRTLKRRHRREIRGIFEWAGFSRVDAASDKEFTFEGHTSDFDDVFVLENVIVLVEYTITQESEVSSHAKKKFIVYEKIATDKEKFIEFCKSGPIDLSSLLKPTYRSHQCVVIILYCSYYNAKQELKLQMPNVTFMDYSTVRYFRMISSTVKKSVRAELLAFLGVPYKKFAERALQNNPSPRSPFKGAVLPETHSNFPKGYKVVSFYMDAASLMSRAYVLRRDGWRDRAGLYQRMIARAKVERVRKYLIEHQRVFINNIIVTLPSETKILDDNDNTVDPSLINATQPAVISIPNDLNSVGIIDGQHRVFSYYEGGPHESIISELRNQQNLLVTGIIYPKNSTDEEKFRFEANLFIEINSNQTNAKSELKQAINQIIHPFSAESIARDVLDTLNDGTGVLANRFTRHYFDAEGLKTTSVVSYGLKPLVRPSAPGPIFTKWNDVSKSTFIASRDDAARKRFIAHCANQIGIFVSAAKSQLPHSRWTTDRGVKDRLITPTVVNGLIGAMRQAVDRGLVIEFEALRDAFRGIDKFDFAKYRSSQYTVMATDIYNEFLQNQSSKSGA